MMHLWPFEHGGATIPKHGTDIGPGTMHSTHLFLFLQWHKDAPFIIFGTLQYTILWVHTFGSWPPVASAPSSPASFTLFHHNGVVHDEDIFSLMICVRLFNAVLFYQSSNDCLTISWFQTNCSKDFFINYHLDCIFGLFQDGRWHVLHQWQTRWRTRRYNSRHHLQSSEYTAKLLGRFRSPIHQCHQCSTVWQWVQQRQFHA